MENKVLNMTGMTCVNCQNRIEKKLRETKGIKNVKVSFNRGTATVRFDSDAITIDEISDVIKAMDFEVAKDTAKPPRVKTRIAGLLLITAVLFFILEYFNLLGFLAPSRLADAEMGYGMMFVIGLITSVHCIAMCGGINLSQCIPRGECAVQNKMSVVRPAFLYNLGRIVSYTLIGFAVGALGSAISFSGVTQGILKLIAGLFMIIMGLNMLGVFPWLRGLNPRMPKIFARIIGNQESKSASPVIIGLLNGFMPCGPLQAMQIYALSTGNPFAGALSMFLFSAGTVPLMFGLGAFTGLIGKKFASKVTTVGAVLVAVLGLSMFSQGWSLSGFPVIGLAAETSSPVETSGNATETPIVDGVQVINSALSVRGYPAITVKVGIPVKWIIDAPENSITGCNDRMIIKEYNIEHSFKPGENVIEFTPDKTGTFQYTCWMGMIKSTITVVE
jgi:sulfite exporter TauE/SafE/copper chaperone CopZ